MAIAQIDGLKELAPYYAWHIRCGRKDYIFVGGKDELKAALSRVRKDPWNAGSSVKYKKIVG